MQLVENGQVELKHGGDDLNKGPRGIDKMAGRDDFGFASVLQANSLHPPAPLFDPHHTCRMETDALFFRPLQKIHP